ncbi:histidine kinase [Algoriphagus sp. H41]|uniref:Histidine kinase n=1 Tax=Algoriphagus oliviformis TaxID=2811231 RepID=A0ABS3C2Q3_9BACT|nr:histidine kinase [Algoriphagus oliviformis]MBN7810881.1 histidine kinase [Algoriphagus oliviformis]
MKPRTSWPLHLIAGICFLLVPVILAPQPPGVSRFQLDVVTVRELFSNGLMLGFFYLNYFILIPRFFLKGKYLGYFLIVLVSFTLILGIPELLVVAKPAAQHPPQFPKMHRPRLVPHPKALDRLFIWDELAAYTYQLLLFSVMVLFSIFLRLREALFDSEQAKSKAEIGNLKNQINPHFLFNTLNSIYALSIREKADKTGQSLMKLSEMMRHVVSEAQHDTVPLQREVAYIENYLNLQRLRLPEDFPLTYHKKGRFEEKKIAPLLLIPFVENAFKHGVSTEEPGEIRIEIALEQDTFSMQVVNRLVSHQLASHEESGLGLENTKSRLELIYGGDYRLEIGEANGYFRVHLQIKLG